MSTWQVGQPVKCTKEFTVGHPSGEVTIAMGLRGKITANNVDQHELTIDINMGPEHDNDVLKVTKSMESLKNLFVCRPAPSGDRPWTREFEKPKDQKHAYDEYTRAARAFSSGDMTYTTRKPKYENMVAAARTAFETGNSETQMYNKSKTVSSSSSGEVDQNATTPQSASSSIATKKRNFGKMEEAAQKQKLEEGAKKQKLKEKEDTPKVSTSIPEIQPKEPQEYSKTINEKYHKAAMPGTASKSSDHTLMKVATSTLAIHQVVDASFEFKSDDTPQDMLKKTEAREKHLEDKEEEVEANIDAIKTERTSCTGKKTSLTKDIGIYGNDKLFRAKVKQLRQELEGVETRLAVIPVELEQSQKGLKDLRAQLKQVREKKNKLKALVARQTAPCGDADAQNMTCVDESGPIENKATEIFQALDRCGDGTVTRRDFYKGMENADVAAFLTLPHGKVKQEGKEHKDVEHAFQEIAGDSDEFDLETFLSKYGSK